jgi:hypothetical protein
LNATLGSLIRLLLDLRADHGDRDDAALALAESDEPGAEHALALIALDPQTDPDLAETCGEALAQVWARRGALDVEVLQRLPARARALTAATVKVLRPSLATEIDRALP